MGMCAWMDRMGRWVGVDGWVCVLGWIEWVGGWV